MRHIGGRTSSPSPRSIVTGIVSPGAGHFRRWSPASALTISECFPAGGAATLSREWSNLVDHILSIR